MTSCETGDLFSESRLAAEFAAFDLAHPDVWRLFESLAFDLIRAGRKKYSARVICNRIRWHYDTSSSGESPKINNNHTPFYARRFVETHPEHGGFFELRRSVADEAALA